MKKKIMYLGVLVCALMLASCSGNKKQTTPTSTPAEMENATKVIAYYNTALQAMKNVANPADINAVLGYMDQTVKVPTVAPIAPPAIASKDTTALMNPGDCFNKEVQHNLRVNFGGMFLDRIAFYDNFDDYLIYMKNKQIDKAKAASKTNLDLSIAISEYKQDLMDMLAPLTEQAEQVLMANEPMKEQLLAMNKMTRTAQSIMNLYSRKHVMETERINLRISELNKEIEAANKLTDVKGMDAENKKFHDYMGTIQAFAADMQMKVQKGEYSDDDYKSLYDTYQYAISLV